MNSHTYGNGGCSDGSYTLTAVPYDRDFKLWANLYNESDTSRLDDVDVTLKVHLE